MNSNRAIQVAFASEKIRQSFEELKAGRFEDKQLAQYIQTAIGDLKFNPLSGINVPRRLWPREYLRDFGIDNLRKYDLPNGWRLLYTLKGNSLEIVSVILEWLKHKDYEKRFGYKVR